MSSIFSQMALLFGLITLSTVPVIILSGNIVTEPIQALLLMFLNVLVLSPLIPKIRNRKKEGNNDKKNKNRK